MAGLHSFFFFEIILSLKSQFCYAKYAKMTIKLNFIFFFQPAIHFHIHSLKKCIINHILMVLSLIHVHSLKKCTINHMGLCMFRFRLVYQYRHINIDPSTNFFFSGKNEKIYTVGV